MRKCTPPQSRNEGEIETATDKAETGRNGAVMPDFNVGRLRAARADAFKGTVVEVFVFHADVVYPIASTRFGTV